MTRLIAQLHVRAISLSSQRGILQLGHISIPCSLGRSGRKHLKREGDGATPVGTFTLRRVFYRKDMITKPCPRSRALKVNDGWCEKAGDRNYNRLVPMPYASAHETMTRADRLYDVVVELSHNERPRVQGHGSAVFFHLRRPDGGPTAGCVGISLQHMRLVLSRVRANARLVITA